MHLKNILCLFFATTSVQCNSVLSSCIFAQVERFSHSFSLLPHSCFILLEFLWFHYKLVFSQIFLFFFLLFLFSLREIHAFILAKKKKKHKINAMFIRGSLSSIIAFLMLSIGSLVSHVPFCVDVERNTDDCKRTEAPCIKCNR